MEPIGIVYGFLSFYGAKGLFKKVRQPLRRAVVSTTSQILHGLDTLKEQAYEVKEGFEDVVAEAQYENMLRKHSQINPDQEFGGMEDDVIS
ncbi:hypothetical protein [Alkaliphilus hydrothermalis]|uniref:DUF5132 domain-containing protein n=1 Tax=Alkaliphilus hydrothermalis TaxID=1482730 RepID=A0ABS2NNC0_9FIRM|nr:hypothetical protein [Alkaliphilus hydrothermalis]MBM7614443.1 hypothetical protein [Alkaliphilus hydrothermalis]